MGIRWDLWRATRLEAGASVFSLGPKIPVQTQVHDFWIICVKWWLEVGTGRAGGAGRSAATTTNGQAQQRSSRIVVTIMFEGHWGGWSANHLNQTNIVTWHKLTESKSVSVVEWDMNSQTLRLREVGKQWFKGKCHEVFCFGFFLESISPKLLIIPLGPFRIFSKIRGDIRSLRFATGVNDTGGKWKKTFKLKNFNNFVWTNLGSRVNIYINFCLQVHLKVSAAWYCCHYLPPVSLIPVAICHRHRWHWWQICLRYRWHRWQIWHRCQQR